MCGCRLSAPHPPLETWPATQSCALTGSRAGDPLVCSLAPSLLSHTSQGAPIFLDIHCAQSVLSTLSHLIQKTNPLVLDIVIPLLHMR